MKYIISFILLMFSITACSGINSDNGSCTQDGVLCIKVNAEDPVRYGESVNLIITTISNEDITDLGISLIYWPVTMTLGEAQSEEPGTEVWKGNSGVDWKVNIMAGVPVTFRRQLVLPGDDGVYTVTAHASTPQRRVIDELTFYQADGNLRIILPGTEIPHAQDPLPTIGPEMLQTLQAMPTRTHYPTLAPKPTKTSTPTPFVYPPPPTPDLDRPGEPYP
jgi:hypothetical protein